MPTSSRGHNVPFLNYFLVENKNVFYSHTLEYILNHARRRKIHFEGEKEVNIK